MARIVVGVDGSEAALHAVREGARLARALGDKLELVAVIRPVLFSAPASPELVERIYASEEKAAAQFLQKAEAEPGVQGLRPTVRVVQGDPGEVLATIAEEPEVGLLVVGSRGRNTAARLLLGSVSDRVVHLASKPVLVVR